MLIQTVVLAVIIGFLRRGRLAGLAELKFRSLWLMLGAFLLQVVVHWAGVKHLKLGTDWIAPAVHIISYLMLITFALLNYQLPGIKLVALGIFLNFLVIAANKGLMPVDPTFLTVQEKQLLLAGQGTHGLLNASAHLTWFADRFLIWAPGWVGGLINQMFSVGDAVIDLGVLLLILDSMSKPTNYRIKTVSQTG